MLPDRTPLVTTIKALCRVCFTCVRECPAKAIRIADGQAEVLPARCVGCGNCVRVCRQHAKQVRCSTEEVSELLAGPAPVAVCMAPSFPAEFTDCNPQVLAGMLRQIGFRLVTETAFGADLVARAYHRLVAESPARQYIATTCPAIVSYVERYHPDLVECLAPIVSPMVAMARALRRLHGAELRVVFVGPCIAKKEEACDSGVDSAVDAVLTFEELRSMFLEQGITPSSVEPSEFDPPHPGAGALFSVARGMLQAALIREDLLTGDVVAADGRSEFVEALRELESGALNARLLEVLCCKGCVMGPGMSSDAPLFSRRARVSRYVRERMSALDREAFHRDMDALADLDLTRRYSAKDQRVKAPSDSEIAEIMSRMGKQNPGDELNCGACGYETCREHAIAIFKGLAESEMCLPYTIDELRRTCAELAISNEQLATAQEALMQSEKLASMGQLAAGIAHEVNNPLGTVLMLSHILLDESPREGPTRDDLKMIADEADRCKKIVAGLLHFARQNKVELHETDVAALIDRSIRSVRVPEHVRLVTECELSHPTAELDRDQMIQVLVNLMNNAITAMPGGGTLTLRATGDAERICLRVRDTGVGIPPENVKKIFEPFFTTKAVGSGTGLGLAVTYGIVKMHRGDIRVESNADASRGPTGTTFVVTLPRRRPVVNGFGAPPAQQPESPPEADESAEGAQP